MGHSSIDFDAAPGGTEQGGGTLARQIQQAVRASTGLSCSIGVAPNKLLAKMASNMQKPDGLVVLPVESQPAPFFT